jgi:hypothetical protein
MNVRRFEWLLTGGMPNEDRKPCTAATEDMPSARAFFRKSDDAPGCYPEIWSHLCDLLDRQTTLVPIWTNTAPGDIERIEWATRQLSPQYVGYSPAVYVSFFRRLHQLGIRVPSLWLDPRDDGAGLQASTKSQPIDLPSWEILKKPSCGQHKLDVRDNAIRILATSLALSASAVAALRCGDIFVNRADMRGLVHELFIDLCAAGRVKPRTLAACGAEARALGQWLTFRRSEGAGDQDSYIGRLPSLITPSLYLKRIVKHMVERGHLFAVTPLPKFEWKALATRRLVELATSGMAAESIAYQLGISERAAAAMRDRVRDG